MYIILFYYHYFISHFAITNNKLLGKMTGDSPGNFSLIHDIMAIIMTSVTNNAIHNTLCSNNEAKLASV